MSEESTATQDLAPDIQLRKVHGAMLLLGECLSTLANVLQQGIRDDNVAARNNAAMGLRRAAHYIDGQPFVPPDAKDL